METEHDKGMTWTFEDLDEFLAAPKADIPGTAMTFAGLKRPDERANVIAYLRTLSDAPVPLPETPTAAAPAAEPPAPPHSEPLPPPPAAEPAPAPAEPPPAATPEPAPAQ
jgi:cytochrome c